MSRYQLWTYNFQRGRWEETAFASILAHDIDEAKRIVESNPPDREWRIVPEVDLDEFLSRYDTQPRPRPS